MSNIAVNDQGDTVEYNGREWVPVRSAVNDEGARVQFVNNQWQAAPQPVPNTPSGIHAKHLADSHNPNVRAQGQAKLDEAQRPLSAGFSAAGEYAAGLADQFVQGITFSHGDEIKAAAQTARDWVTGGDGNYSDYVAENRRGVQEFRNENPKASIVSEGVGAVATAGGLPKLLAKQLPRVAGALVPNSFLRAGTVGATEGAVYGAGVGEGQDKLESAVLGSLLGGVTGPLMYGAGEGIARLGRYVPDGITSKIPGIHKYTKDWEPEGVLAKRNLKTAEDLGFQIAPGDRIDHGGVKKVEDILKKNWASSGPHEKRTAHNQELAQRIANKELGIDGIEVDLGKAKQVNSKAFADVSNSGAKIELDEQFLRDVDGIQRSYQSAWGKGSKSKLFDDVMDEVDAGDMSARRYMDLMSRLSDDLYKAANRGDGAQVRLYRELQQALDSAADRTMPKDVYAAFHKARQAFRSRKTLESRGVVNPATGEISIPKLGNALNKNDDFIYGWDQTDLSQVGRMHHAYKTSIGDSGTGTGTSGALLGGAVAGPVGVLKQAIPNRMYGSTGAGKKIAQLAPFTLPAWLDDYRREGRER